MAQPEKTAALTGALEDYLETILVLVRDKKLARIKDIAKARGVKSGSVSPAMRRLSDLGLVNYIEREYIDLTPEGERLARRVYAKHQVLTRFFAEILKMTREDAVENACAMEHSLSDEGMDHLVRFFEFIKGCPEGEAFIERFHRCSLVHPDRESCNGPCPRDTQMRESLDHTVTLAKMSPGDKGRIVQISDAENLRGVLIDKGLVPNVSVECERCTPKDDLIIISIDGFSLSLTAKEAISTVVEIV